MTPQLRTQILRALFHATAQHPPISAIQQHLKTEGHNISDTTLRRHIRHLLDWWQHVTTDPDQAAQQHQTHAHAAYLRAEQAGDYKAMIRATVALQKAYWDWHRNTQPDEQEPAQTGPAELLQLVANQ